MLLSAVITGHRRFQVPVTVYARSIELEKDSPPSEWIAALLLVGCSARTASGQPTAAAHAAELPRMRRSKPAVPTRCLPCL